MGLVELLKILTNLQFHQFFQMFITGTLPKLAEGAEITYPDHEDEYRREGPGITIIYFKIFIESSLKQHFSRILEMVSEFKLEFPSNWVCIQLP